MTRLPLKRAGKILNYIGKLNQKVNFIMIKVEGGSMKSSMIMVEILSKKYVFESHFALSLKCFKL